MEEGGGGGGGGDDDDYDDDDDDDGDDPVIHKLGWQGKRKVIKKSTKQRHTQWLVGWLVDTMDRLMSTQVQLYVCP
jgi:hypothetical protein